MAGRKPQGTAGAGKQGMYSTIPIHCNIKSAPASLCRSRVGPALYVFSFLGCSQIAERYAGEEINVSIEFRNIEEKRRDSGLTERYNGIGDRYRGVAER